MNKIILSIAILTGVFSVVAGGLSIAATNISNVSHRDILSSKLQAQTKSAEDSIRQTNAEEQQKALKNIWQMNRMQTSYRADNSSFALLIDRLAANLDRNSQYYDYSIRSSNSRDFVLNLGTAKNSSLKNYLGIVVIWQDKEGRNRISSNVCFSTQANQRVTPIKLAPKMREDLVICPSGYVESTGKHLRNRDGSFLEDRNGYPIRGD